jgi:hypothetical protein
MSSRCIVGCARGVCCCQGGRSVDAVPRKGVPRIFGGIPNTYLGISLWDGDPEAIELSVIKRRDAARLSLRESHDISVGISAHQILVR